MTPLDQALATLHEDPENIESRNGFYQLFLASTFFVPTYDEENGGVAKKPSAQPLPLVIEADDNHYLMVFDNRQKVYDWSEEGANCLEIPGYVLVQMATEGLHIAMNAGTTYSKQFVPDEINWLKEIVNKSAAAASESREESAD